MALHNGRLYRTEDEIEYINRIGKGPTGDRSLFGRQRLLKLYLNACLVRHNWCHLDKERIIGHVRERLQVEFS